MDLPETNFLKWLFCLLWMLPASAWAQHYTAADSVAVYNYLNEADEADYAGKLDDAQALVNKAMQLSRQKGFARGEGFAWLKTADLKLKKEGTDSLPVYYQKAIGIGQKLKDHFLTGLAHMQQSQQQAQEAMPEAENSCKQAIHFFEQTDSLYYTGLAFNHLGYIQERAGKYEDATRHNLQAITIFDKVGNTKESANTLGNQAVMYYKLGKKEDALQMFKQSAARRETIADVKGLAATYGNIVTVYMPVNMDSARKYLALQLTNAEKSGIGLNIAQAYVNQMAILGKEKKFAEALVFEKKAMDLYNKLGDKSKLTFRYINAASISNQMNDSVQAVAYYGMADSLGKLIKSKPMLQNMHQGMSDFYKNRGNHQLALQHLISYYAYRDSLINEKTATNIAELQTKYDTEKKDNEIAQLQASQKIQQLELERKQALINGNQQEARRKQTEIELLKQQQLLRDASLVAAATNLEKQQLINKTSEQQLELSHQALKTAKTEKELSDRKLADERWLRNIIIAGVIVFLLLALLLFNRYQLRKKIAEQQRLLDIRNHISKDLHDEIGSTLTSINILSKVSQQAFEKDPEQAREMLSQISLQSKAIQQNMSDIVWSIRPDNEAVGSLETRMREYVAQTLEPLSIQAKLFFDPQLQTETLSGHSRKELLLICKEAVNNIVKHANASRVDIRFTKAEHHIQLQIQDNGSWKQNGGSGTGTKSMQQRAEAMGGTLVIQTGDTGTTVVLTIPY